MATDCTQPFFAPDEDAPESLPVVSEDTQPTLSVPVSDTLGPCAPSNPTDTPESCDFVTRGWYSEPVEVVLECDEELFLPNSVTVTRPARFTHSNVSQEAANAEAEADALEEAEGLLVCVPRVRILSVFFGDQEVLNGGTLEFDVVAGEDNEYVFTVNNLPAGNSSLEAVASTASSGFSITAQLDVSIPLGSSSTFTVTGTTLSAEITGVIVITSNATVSPFSFSIVLNSLVFESYTPPAPVNVYGITEFSSVSSPPRKYRQLVNNLGGFERTSGSISPTFTGNYMAGDQANTDTTSQRVRYSLAGVRNRDLSITASLGNGTSFPDLLTAEGIEDYSLTPNGWTPYAPTWTREKSRKYYTTFPPAPGEGGIGYYHGWSIIRTGVAGSAMGMRFTTAWHGTGWTLTFNIGGDVGTGGVGGNQLIQVFARTITGDRNPVSGDVTSSDFFVGQATPNTASTTFALNLPPDTSVRFMLQRLPLDGNHHPPAQVPWQLVDAADPATDKDQWFYFPATNSKPWLYEETLEVEYRYTDAIIQAGGYAIGGDTKAVTNSLTGGTGAESHTAMVFDGRTVLASTLFVDLLPNHRYLVNVTNRDNTIGLTDFTESVDSVDIFRTTGTTYSFTYETKAPAGKERQTLSMALTDLGEVSTPSSSYSSETIEWHGRVLAAGGSVSSGTLDIVDALIVQLKSLNLFSNLYLLPLVGNDLLAALTPIGRFSNLRSTVTGFVDADYSESTGLQGNGTSKIITLPWTATNTVFPSAMLAHWELAVNHTGTSTSWPCGMEEITSGPFTQGRYGLLLSSINRGGSWGRPPNGDVHQATPAANGLISMVFRSVSERESYFNGASIATNTIGSDLPHLNAGNLRWMGRREDAGGLSYWAGRAGCFALSSANYSDANMLSLYETLRDYLLTPTGKI